MLHSRKILNAVAHTDNTLALFRLGLEGSLTWTNLLRLFTDNSNYNFNVINQAIRASIYGKAFMKSIEDLRVTFASFDSNGNPIYKQFLALSRLDRFQQRELYKAKISSRQFRDLIDKDYEKNVNFILTVAIFTHFYIDKIRKVFNCPTDTQITALRHFLSAPLSYTKEIDGPLNDIYKEFRNAYLHFATSISAKDMEFFDRILNKIIANELETTPQNKTLFFLNNLKNDVSRSIYNDTKRKLKFWDAEPAEGIVLLREKLWSLPVIPAHMIDDILVLPNELEQKQLPTDQALKKIKVIAKEVETILEAKSSTNPLSRSKLVHNLYLEATNIMQQVAALEKNSFTAKKDLKLEFKK